MSNIGAGITADNTGHSCGMLNPVARQLPVKTCHASSWLRSTMTGRGVTISLSVASTTSAAHEQYQLSLTAQDIPIRAKG